MTKINMNTNASYNFKAPEIASDENKKIEVVFPTSEAQTVESGATIAVSVVRTTTMIDLGELSANGTVNATIGNDVPVGAVLTVKAKSDTTARSVTWGTGFEAPALAGTISKTKMQSFMFDGINFVAIASPVQLD